MKTNDIENKLATTPSTKTESDPATCPAKGAHRLYVGVACPVCGSDIPAGPHDPATFARYFAQVVSPTEDPAVAANPRSPELLDAEREAEVAGEELQRATGKVLATEAEIDALRSGNARAISSVMLGGAGLDTVSGRTDRIEMLRQRLQAEQEALNSARERHRMTLERVNALRAERQRRINVAMGMAVPETRGQSFVRGLRTLIGG